MERSRRNALAAAVGALGTVALAGCNEATDPTPADGTGSTQPSTERTERTTSDGTQPTAGQGTESFEAVGGPNVVEGVPEDADHVVAAEQVAFAPTDLTIGVGDTVAFEHTDGPAHTVTAREDGIPDDATYWASGGYDSQAAAETGFEAYDGVIVSGQTYVHTFDTPGTHEYYCIPHSNLQMEGSIVVEP